ncbi:trihelix transcription factor DF1-like [Juglans microcarpa x Juglans regia]|uniref:trihelix transcription factor DF1-like n=1 Tax=Juglans microcarpa x Juglans regia TaxID=2249226 RepID=UPI001B7F5AFA|nr:trihelix transcription factor DF1-like [Juglans microcarpa x Juglans regia]
MLGDSGSSVLGSSGTDAVAEHMAAAVPAHDSAEVGGVGSNSGEEDKGYKGDEGDRSYGGNRWPRQETLALLKIRSEMDVAFKDASVKGPLWEDVSRKLAELGYHRSAKKCKEKFENVYKYHKRTKEGRTGKSDGKTYRFFDQLEALENHPASNIQSSTPVKPQQNIVPATVASTATSVAMRPLAPNPPISLPQITVTSVSHSTMNMSQGINVAPAVNLTIPSFPLTNPTILPPPPPPTTTNPSHTATIPSSFPNLSTDLLSNSTSSSTSSDEELQVRRKRKRKWKDFLERLMREVIQKQEELQRKFLEAIEKREHERMIREEAWRMQEMSRINREREILAQERSIAAAKDAAVMAFLQKISEQQSPGQAFQYDLPQPQPAVQPAPPPAPQPALVVAVTQPAPVSAPATVLPHTLTGFEIQKFDNGKNCTPTSSSRWPKVEVQALIKLRTNLDAKYQDNGPKGPLWEEISAAMRKIGYNRSAKRCKEKWENINKYFKKVKESNKKRPEDSKTCPYFHQLDALYREKNKFENPSPTQVLKPGNTNMVPLMVRPEQQWPPQQEHPSDDAAMDDVESEPMDQNQEEDDKEGDEEEEDEDEDEDGGGNFEIVASKRPASMGAAE